MNNFQRIRYYSRKVKLQNTIEVELNNRSRLRKLMEEDQTNCLIQQKIRKMVQNRRTVTKKQSDTQQKDQKYEIKVEDQSCNQKNSTQIKPTFTIKMQTISASRKQLQTPLSQTTTSTLHNDIEPISLINLIVDSGPTLINYLHKHSLNPEIIKNMLTRNQIFTLSLQNKLKTVGKEYHEDEVEKEICSKLERIRMIERQHQACILAEQKINILLDHKMKALHQN